MGIEVDTDHGVNIDMYALCVCGMCGVYMGCMWCDCGVYACGMYVWYECGMCSLCVELNTY